MLNFVKVTNRLDQEALNLFCDEGVFRIALDIHLQKKMDFVILFHCIRKYNQGFDIEEGLRQTEVFGVDVVDAVLNGKNYVRSLKGYLILAYAIEKLRWEAFLEHNDLHEFREFAKSLKEFQIALASKNSEERKNSYHIYLS